MTVPSSDSSSTAAGSPTRASNTSASTKVSSDDAPMSVETMHTPFAPFNPASVSGPFDDDARGAAQHENEMVCALLETTLAFHAWANARPRAATREAGEVLAGEVRAIADDEERQEMARRRLVAFVAHIKSAVIALTMLPDAIGLQ